MNESETRLWHALSKSGIGFKVRRQYPVGPYILDFFVFEARLCIEVDGVSHDLRPESDAKRDEYLLSIGIETMRIPSLAVWDALDETIDAIYFRCCERTGKEL